MKMRIVLHVATLVVAIMIASYFLAAIPATR